MSERWEGADLLLAGAFEGPSSSGPLVVSFEEPRMLGAGTNKDMRAFMVRCSSGLSCSSCSCSLYSLRKSRTLELLSQSRTLRMQSGRARTRSSHPSTPRKKRTSSPPSVPVPPPASTQHKLTQFMNQQAPLDSRLLPLRSHPPPHRPRRLNPLATPLPPFLPPHGPHQALKRPNPSPCQRSPHSPSRTSRREPRSSAEEGRSEWSRVGDQGGWSGEGGDES